MKNIFYSLIALALLFSSSCTNLDVAPEDAFTEDEIFKDVNAYRAYLAKNYAAFSHTGQDGPAGNADISIVNDEGFTSYNRVYWKAQQLTTDETVISWTDAGIQDLHTHTWTSENQFVRVLYYRIALIVSISNDFIRQSTDDKLGTNGITGTDADEVRAYQAEARFLRALAYWHALDLFRSIPLVTEISTDLPSKATAQEIYDFIESELKEIESLLPAPGTNEYGRADQGALWMLQAKLYLNASHLTGQDKWTECIDACKKVIGAGYQLDEEYQHLFLADNHLSNEIIFPLIADGRFAQNWGSTTFLVHGAMGGTMDDDADETLATYGVTGGWGGMRATSSLVEKFPDVTGDIDNRAIFYTDGQTLEIDDLLEFTEGYAVPKFKNLSRDGTPGSDLTHADIDYPMFRLGDAYLMYAEAILRGGTGGDMGEAIGYINDLRNRAYDNDPAGQVTMEEVDLPFILDERSREMYWEGTRRIDLIRFEQFSTSGIWPWKGGVKEGMTTEAKRDFFPLPASDLLANPNLEQNEPY
ncbi:MAG: RagB/SusD family nutrient uptake outer membrane protein [Saprospiraceae bacterium]